MQFLERNRYRVAEPSERQPCTNTEKSAWPSASFLRFEELRESFRAWHETPAFLDWIQSNERAVTLLSSSNVRPLAFSFDNVSGTGSVAARESGDGEVLSLSGSSVRLTVHTACCGVSTELSEVEQLTLASLPRIFPARSNSRTKASISVPATSFEHQQRILDGLLTRLHDDTCVWHDASTPTAGQWRNEPCSVRQVLLGGPSLSVTDAPLVRTFCAAVTLRSLEVAAEAGVGVGVGGGADAAADAGVGASATPRIAAAASARARCLLPRGTPPSAVQRWIRETVVGWSTAAPKMRYEGCNVDDRILQVLFQSKKRVREEAGASGDDHTADASGEVAWEYVSQLMALHGYVVAAKADAPDIPRSSEQVEEAEGDGCSGDNETASASLSAATMVDRRDVQDGDRHTHTETHIVAKAIAKSKAAELLNRRISCRFCAHQPWIQVQHEDRITLTTTTTTTMQVITKADPIPAAEERTQPDASKTKLAVVEVKKHPDATVDGETLGHVNQNYGEVDGEQVDVRNVPAPAALENVEAEVDEHGEEEEQRRDAKQGADHPEASLAGCDETTTADADPNASTPEPQEATADSAISALEAACNSAPMPATAAITTITKACTHTAKRMLTASTTTITVTVSRRSAAASYEAGHHESCPWHRLYLADAVDASAPTVHNAAERYLDFAWVVEDGAAEPTVVENGTDTNDAAAEVRGTALHPVPEDNKEEKEADTAAAALTETGVDSASEEVTHRTLLVVKFPLAEVERLITSWRLSEEWERIRADQYLRHPLWRTWNSPGPLHPIHTDAADSAMEQYLRGLEKKLTASVKRDRGTDEEQEPEQNRNQILFAPSKTTVDTLASSTAASELLATVGAPLYHASVSTGGSTVEAVLRVAHEALQRCFKMDATCRAEAVQPTEIDARTLLKSGLQALLRAGESAEVREPPAVTAATEHAANTSGSMREFLLEAQRRYNEAAHFSVDRHGPALTSLGEKLHTTALPRVLHLFTALRYPQVHSAPSDSHDEASVEDGQRAVSSSLPHFVAPKSGKTETSASTTSHATLSKTDRERVAKYLQDMRQTILEEQQQLQRQKEAEAAHLAAAAVRANTAATATATAHPAAPMKAPSSLPHPHRQATPALHRQAMAANAASPQPAFDGPQTQPQHLGGGAGAHPAPYNSAAPTHHQRKVHAQPWRPGREGGGQQMSPYPSHDSHTGRGNEASMPGNYAPMTSGYPPGGPGLAVIPNTSNAVFGSGYAFGWSPLEARGENMSGSGGVVGGPVMPSLPQPSVLSESYNNSGGNAGSNAASGILQGAPYRSTESRERFFSTEHRAAGGRLSDASRSFNAAAESSILGSMNAGGSGTKEEERLSNWSMSSTPHGSGNGGGGGGGGGGILGYNNSEGGILHAPSTGAGAGGVGSSVGHTNFRPPSSSSPHPQGSALPAVASQSSPVPGRGGRNAFVPTPRSANPGHPPTNTAPPLSGPSTQRGNVNGSANANRPVFGGSNNTMNSGANASPGGGGRGNRSRSVRGGPIWRGGGGNRGGHRRGGG